MLGIRKAQGLTIVLAVLVSLTITTVAYGQPPRWSQPVPLSPSELSAWFPDVATDLTGQVHIVWSAAPGDYDTVMYTTSPDSQEWSAPTDIAALPQTAGSEATRPSILIDPQGIFHLTYRYTTVYYSQARIESARTANSWLLPTIINRSGNVAYFSRMAEDGLGRLHLVFTENVPTAECSICYHVFYRQSDDNGHSWSAPIDISDLPTGAAKPQILIDRQDNIHVVWESGPGGSYGQVGDPIRVMYTVSRDRGMTWAAPLEFATPSGKARNVAIGLDGEGKLLVAWLGAPEDLVYYQFSRDQGYSWSPRQSIPAVWGGITVFGTYLDSYAMATDSAGNVHLVLVGRTAQDQKSLSVLHLTWNGSAWSEPEAITTLQGDVPEWPRIAVGNGNQLHVVWFVRDEAHVWDTDRGQYQIWYARGTASAPPVPPIAWPTASPTPQHTPMPTVMALPQPLKPNLNTTQPPDAVSAELLTTDTDDLLLLAKSLAPVALLIAIVAIGAHLGKRAHLR